MIAATGFAADVTATPELAAAAVKNALANAGSDFAHGVILYLSSHFVRHAQPAITAASRVARCLQVSGGTVPGVFTEKSWSLEQPAAAALVLCGPVSLGMPRDNDSRLCFAVRSQIDSGWFADGALRYGTLASAATADNGARHEVDGQVWTQGKLCPAGRAEMAFHGGQLQISVSRGMRILTPLLEVNDSDNFEVLQLGDDTALDSLLRQLDPDTRKLDTLPPLRIFAALPEPGIDPDLAMAQDRYSLLPILRVNRDERSVTLAAPLPLHSRLCWAMRDPACAEQDMNGKIESIATRTTPAFALMFSCIGRGPYFYSDGDRDLALIVQRFPGMPLLGAYSAGEIAPQGPRSNLISYSSVVAAVSSDV